MPAQDTPLRRIPQQERSQRRVDEILDAAAELFAELGYEAATTNAIAERAEVAIGTLYRYFPDKEAILRAFVERHQEQIHALYQQLFTPDLVYLPLPVVLDRLIDPFVELHVTCPAYKQVLLGPDISPDIAEAAEAEDDQVMQRIVEFLELGVPTLSKEQARIKATVCKAVVKALISMINLRDDVEEREHLCREVKSMLLSYLAPLFEA